MRCLDHDAGAITCIAFATTGTPVFHVLQDRQGVGDDLMGFIPFYVGDEADATGIPLKRRMV